MRVRILAVGEVRGALAPAIAEYEKRIGHYFRFSVDTVDAGTKRGKDDPSRVKRAEAERLMGRIDPSDMVVVVTRDGRDWDSRELSRRLDAWAVEGRSGVVFVIGGAWGFDDTVLGRANARLSLSAMTLPHEMARLILAEQIYRAGTLQRNEPYHKGP